MNYKKAKKIKNLKTKSFNANGESRIIDLGGSSELDKINSLNEKLCTKKLAN